ncbi:MAG: HDOD domain-containing protein [Deltaproteobacteria bacterium]|nr:MAG: HDOD domain-containing protein [Deltaproteobacteria bacterium]
MTEQEVRQLRAEVIARRNLPTIPPVLARILQLCDGVDANTNDLIAVIERDQALTGKLLRLANSACFGQSRRVATIPRAVVLLGFTTVRNLTLGVKVWDALGSGVARPRLEELWTHSVACAVAARELTVRLQAGDPDEAFTAGLLLDVGRLALAVRFRDEYWKVVGGVAETEDMDAVEREAFGVGHPEVGAWMLDAWALPPGIVEGVRLHHDEARRLAGPAILAVTDRLVACSDLASGEIGPRARELLELTSAQGLTREVWEATLARLGEDGTRTASGLRG